MNKKIIISIALTLVIGLTGTLFAQNTKQAPQKKQTTQNTSIQNEIIINTTPLNVVSNPARFLNKTIKMQATFDKFSTLGLDYKKALRPGNKYIGILIQRDDVIDHNIPLSEMKIFMSKEMAEKHIDLDTGDKIEIVANVFSTALNDPWLDIKNLKVIKKIKKEISEESKKEVTEQNN